MSRPTREEVQEWIGNMSAPLTMTDLAYAYLAALDVVEAADSAAPWDDDALLDALRRWWEG